MRFLVLGAGRMGYAVVYDLVQNKSTTQIMVVDSEDSRLEYLKSALPDKRIATVKADVGDCTELGYLMSGCDVVVSCVTYKYNYDLAKTAMESGASFCDLGGNEDIVRKQFLLNEMAREKGVTIIPDCGLAPGMVSILAAAGFNEFDTVDEIKLRVGGLPQEPDPPLNYSLSFSVEGLINEYVEDATVIRNGKLLRVPSLTDLEELDFPDPFGMLEAFNTSGGISTLPTTLGTKCRNLDYKTIRYPGHCQLVGVLKDLGLMETKPMKVGMHDVRPRAILATLLEQKLPREQADVVLVRVTVSGQKADENKEISFQCVDYMDETTGLSAMMRMTAFPISIIAQMIASGQITERGSKEQELVVPPQPFLNEMAKRGIKIDRSERKLAAR